MVLNLAPNSFLQYLKELKSPMHRDGSVTTKDSIGWGFNYTKVQSPLTKTLLHIQFEFDIPFPRFYSSSTSSLPNILPHSSSTSFSSSVLSLALPTAQGCILISNPLPPLIFSTHSLSPCLSPLSFSASPPRSSASSPAVWQFSQQFFPASPAPCALLFPQGSAMTVD